MNISVSNLDECYKLQNDINVLTNWCENNCMFLNVDKCNSITFTMCKNFH